MIKKNRWSIVVINWRKLSIKQIYQRDSLFSIVPNFSFPRKFIVLWVRDSSLLFVYFISDSFLPRIKNFKLFCKDQEERLTSFRKKRILLRSADSPWIFPKTLPAKFLSFTYSISDLFQIPLHHQGDQTFPKKRILL